MAETKAAKKSGQPPAKRTTRKTAKAFTDEEQAAMRERAQEQKAARSGGRASQADGESELLAKIAEMSESDRAMAEALHALVKASAPDLTPKTWYGMPAYAKDGDVVCFFQPARKFKTRYATLGFSDKAHLDEGTMWPNAYALTELNGDAEAQIRELLKRATL
jgi:uncharacterized protein YdhG (YjbR/CyaY superfamily)